MNESTPLVNYIKITETDSQLHHITSGAGSWLGKRRFFLLGSTLVIVCMLLIAYMDSKGTPITTSKIISNTEIIGAKVTDVAHESESPESRSSASAIDSHQPFEGLGAPEDPTNNIAGVLSKLEAMKIVVSYESEGKECADCTEFIQFNCSIKTNPVLNGLDLVQYFTEFALPDGSGYNESLYGDYLNNFDYEYKGYIYSFKSERNRKLFVKDPEQYIPQYGGFCAHGITAEFCPKFPWGVNCMGPMIARQNWTIYKGKLYFFWFSGAKDVFLENPDDAIAVGDARWYYLYGNSGSNPQNTNCVMINQVD